MFFGNAKIVDDIVDYSSRNITGMLGLGNQPVRLKWIAVMTVATGLPDQLATQIAQSFINFSSLQKRIFLTHLSDQYEFGAESLWNWTAGIPKSFKVRFGGGIEVQGGLKFACSPGVTAGKNRTSGNPDTVFVLSQIEPANVYQHCIFPAPKTSAAARRQAIPAFAGMRERRQIPFFNGMRDVVFIGLPFNLTICMNYISNEAT